MSASDFIRISGQAPEAERVAEVVAHLRGGGLLAYPTETVYGFGCALRPEPLARLFRLKRSDASKPLLVLISSRDDVATLGWTPGAEALARAFWPGPLTLVLPDPTERFPAEVRNTHGGVAVRASPHPVVRAILEALEEPITSTSANVPGEAPARSAAGALEAAVRLLRETELDRALRVVDGGTLAPSESSTLVEFSGQSACLRRRGVIPLDALQAVHPEIDDSEVRG
ncbi:MAG: L-threonylcarbamoyladenylate synthase [Gemmatimonadota bacterium]